MAEGSEAPVVGDILDDYIRDLVERTYSDTMDDDAKSEAVIDLKQAFQKLYGARLLEQFTDEQQEEIEKLVDASQPEKVIGYAVHAGINMPAFMTEVITEFEQLYAPAAEE